MGVDTNHYILFGHHYNYKEISPETIDAILEIDCEYSSESDNDKVYTIIDGMSAEYIFVGYIIKESEYGFEVADTRKLYSEMVNKPRTALKEFTEKYKLPDKPISLYVFTHYY